jgi:hypothetical protein
MSTAGQAAEPQTVRRLSAIGSKNHHEEETMLCHGPANDLVFLVILLLAACTTPITNQAPSPTVFPTAIPATPTAISLPPTPTVDPILETEKLMKGFAAAWAAHASDELLSYYSQNVKSYDATAYGQISNYSEINHVLHGAYLNGAFDVKIVSFFVSEDGRFAATVGTFAEKDSSGRFFPKPYVSLLKVDQSKIVWVYDYYGGSASKIFPPQEIPDTANQPASSTQIVPETKTIVTEWEKAYNGKDSQAFISFYADEAKYIQVIAPEWHVFTKDKLSQEMTSKFRSENFDSKLNDFFISADGHFVAVQGIYTDAKASEMPMVILMKIENGKITEQYDYLVYEEDL